MCRVLLQRCSFTHDSGAALVVGGALTGMVEEERLSGIRHTRDYPAEAVRWLLADAGIAPADIDIVAYNFDGRLAARQPRPQFRWPMPG